MQAVMDEFAKRGWKTTESGQKISKNIVRKRLLESHDELTALYKKKPKHKKVNSFRRFVLEHVKRTASPRISITRKRVLFSYRDWAEKHSYYIVSEQRIDAIIKELGWKTGRTTKGDILYKGISAKFKASRRRE